MEGLVVQQLEIIGVIRLTIAVLLVKPMAIPLCYRYLAVQVAAVVAPAFHLEVLAAEAAGAVY